jgi:hypothetical protein
LRWTFNIYSHISKSNKIGWAWVLKALGPTYPWVPGDLCLGVKRPSVMRNTSPSSAEVKTYGAIPPSLPYVFTSRWLKVIR